MIRAALSRFGRRNLFFLLGTLLFVLGAKFTLIWTYGCELPFWDQWDAEGDSLYLSAAHGHLTPANFFAPHNEHRIVFTKLLAFTLEKINGEWDARLEMTVNAFLHLAAIAALLLALKAMVDRAAWLVGCLISTALFAIPLAWENTLGGFQSQFYFLALFSVLHLAGSFLSVKPWQRWAAQVAGLCAILSMGSGFFSALAILIFLALKAGIEREVSREDAQLLIANVALALMGAALHVEHPEHAPLHVQNAHQFIDGLLAILAWPASSRWFSGFGFCALVVVFVAKLRSRSIRAGDCVWCALFIWWLLQVVATVVARGNSTVLSSRYLDLFAIGVILMSAAWTTLLVSYRFQSRWKVAVGLAASAWLIGIGLGVRAEWKNDLREYLDPMPQFNAQRIATVRDFVQTHSNRFFTAEPFTHLPYPYADRLGALLSDDGLVAVLPNSVRLEKPTQEPPWLRRVAEALLRCRGGFILLGLTLQAGAIAAILARGRLLSRSASPLPSA